MLTQIFVTLVALLLAVPIYASTGLDVASLTSATSFGCAKKLGYDKVIVRCYMEAYGANPGGRVDPNCYQNYLNAKKGGFSSIDIYMFPCTGRKSCKAPSTQVREIINYVGQHKMIVGRLWLDVEVDPAAKNWPLIASNRDTLQQFKTTLNRSGWKWGVYASASQWQRVTGSLSWVLDSSQPLWYSHYDSVISFSDFKPFGGWKTPFMKQYAGNQRFCGASWDKNYNR